jgi:RNA polymerase sigma-70 factor (ECF subfamily)
MPPHVDPPRKVSHAIGAVRPGGDGDRVLLERLRARDEAALSALVDRHHAAMLRLAATFVPSRAVAEEVVQETWLAVIDGIDRFEGRSSVKTWIFHILVNRARTRGVRERRQVPLSSFADDSTSGEGAPVVDAHRFDDRGRWTAPPRGWTAHDVERRLMTQEAVAFLDERLAQLPPSQRAVLLLRDVDGLDAEAACAVLGISEGNQRVLLHRARASLRTDLERFVDPE